jgi:two-component system sensor histidine kinase SenX3
VTGTGPPCERSVNFPGRPPGATYARRVDTPTIVLGGVVALLVGVAIWAILRNRRHAGAVDDAIGRIGAAAPRRTWHRSQALAAALSDLERSTATAQRERARLAGAVQAAPLGILVTDDHGVVVASNAAAGRFLGARVGEAIAEARIREAIEQAILRRTATSAEVELFTPVRSILEVSAVPLDFGVESVGAVAFVDDVTEARRVAAMRRDFVANVGHELKTPLGAVAVLAETLSDSLGDPAVAASLAERLRGEATRLSKLIEDILDLSQAEALAAHDEPVAVAEVLEDAARAVTEAAAVAGVDVEVVPCPADVRVAGDARQLGSMVSNLVENAVKYSFVRQPDLRPKVTVRAEARGDDVVIEVADQGIGIPAAHLDRIFERFYRVDRARSRETGGTGLGLSIVRHIARNHRGEVTVESVEGEGSTFRVTLPRWRKS